MSIARTRARWRDIWSRFSGAGAYPEELAWLLLMPLRGLIFSPRQLLDYLSLAPDARVLEIGPGPGFFSVPVARALPDGRLELVDIQAGMLVKARRRVRDHGVRNAGFIRASATMLPFVRGSFDHAFLVAVLGEVSDPPACVAAIADALRPGGRLVCVELPGDADALTAEQLQAYARSAPLRFVESVRIGQARLTAFERTAAA